VAAEAKGACEYIAEFFVAGPFGVAVSALINDWRDE